jgi:hypothetical protein
MNRSRIRVRADTAQAKYWFDFEHESAYVDETWYRIPDSWRIVSCVSSAFTEYHEETHETHETHETGLIRAPIGAPGTGPVLGPVADLGCVLGTSSRRGSIHPLEGSRVDPEFGKEVSGRATTAGPRYRGAPSHTRIDTANQTASPAKIARANSVPLLLTALRNGPNVSIEPAASSPPVRTIRAGQSRHLPQVINSANRRLAPHGDPRPA